MKNEGRSPDGAAGRLAGRKPWISEAPSGWLATHRYQIALPIAGASEIMAVAYLPSSRRPTRHRNDLRRGVAVAAARPNSLTILNGSGVLRTDPAIRPFRRSAH